MKYRIVENTDNLFIRSPWLVQAKPKWKFWAEWQTVVRASNYYNALEMVKAFKELEKEVDATLN